MESMQIDLCVLSIQANFWSAGIEKALLIISLLISIHQAAGLLEWFIREVGNEDSEDIDLLRRMIEDADNERHYDENEREHQPR